jgi:Tol biopolymer transport system component
MKSPSHRYPAMRQIAMAISVAGLAVAVAAPMASAASPSTKRVNVTNGGAQALGPFSWLPTSSETGRFVTFAARTTNLAPGDTDDFTDIYWRDMKKSKTVWLSYPKSGLGTGDSRHPSISSSGRFVAFHSDASSIVGSDTNGFTDVFIQDLTKRKNKRISVNSREQQASGGGSERPSISGSGRYVAFESEATNLVKNDTNGERDVFVRDRKTGKTTRVSVRSNGKQAWGGESRQAAISKNGRFVAFASEAKNLVRGDTNAARDVFVHDRRTGRTRRVSIRSNGRQGNTNSGNPALSADGRYVAFGSAAKNLVKKDTNGRTDVFVHDRRTAKTTRVSVRSDGKQATGSDSFGPSISANGRYVAFESYATNLFGSDTNGEADVFVHDRKKRRTRVQSRNTDGVASDGKSWSAGISPDGRFVVFQSTASDLVIGDTNDAMDVFRRGPLR